MEITSGDGQKIVDREIDDRTIREELLSQVRKCVARAGPRDEVLKAICRLLYDGIDRYDWVGFYFVDASRKVLRLGPYVGAPTRHVKIPFGQGVCGLAAQKRQALMVPDVFKVVNYLSCSPRVKSEFVMPIFVGSRMAAELDIDSHTLDAFGKSDKDFLEAVAGAVAEIL